MTGLLYHLVSLGCAKNRVDSENIMGLLGEAGFTYTPDPAAAEVIVVNPCSFIGPARRESVAEILRLAQYKRGKCRVLLVAGCLPARHKGELFREIPAVDALVSPANLDRVPWLVRRCLAGARATALRPRETPAARLPRLATGPPHSAYVKIADGCNHTCSFCIIPRLRGPYKSRPLEEILGEAESLVAAGARELNLVAQDTTFYGLDLYGKKMLPKLLRRLATLQDLAWVRILYGHPDHVDGELLQVIREEEKVCPYLDLPLQHCAGDILRRMGRGAGDLGALLALCRQRVPGIVLRSTFIVGFPGERRRHYRELLKFLEAESLDRVGVFPYSREEGTPAAAYPGQVRDRVKKHRLQEAMALLQQISLAGNQKLVGETLMVLVERREAGGSYAGRYYGQAPEVDGSVFFTSKAGLNPGDLVRVRVTEALNYDLKGEVLP